MTELTSARNVAILGVEGFTVSQPFTEGHACSAAEAKALNQLRRENLGNNFRSSVQAFLDRQDGKEAAEGTAETEEELRTRFAELDGSYQFTISNVGGGRTAKDPVEREARSMARDLVKKTLAEQGYKFNEAPEGKTKEEWDDIVEANVDRVAQMDEIVKIAAATVKARQKSANVQGLELNLNK